MLEHARCWERGFPYFVLVLFCKLRFIHNLYQNRWECFLENADAWALAWHSESLRRKHLHFYPHAPQVFFMYLEVWELLVWRTVGNKVEKRAFRLEGLECQYLAFHVMKNHWIFLSWLNKRMEVVTSQILKIDCTWPFIWLNMPLLSALHVSSCFILRKYEL